MKREMYWFKNNVFFFMLVIVFSDRKNNHQAHKVLKRYLKRHQFQSHTTLNLFLFL